MPEKAALGVDLVILSPGVPASKLPLAALQRASVSVWGELELGFRRFRGYIAAVSGTNGKSTVTTLLGDMAARAFSRVFVGGNLGTPLAEAAGEAFDWGVVEVSSFQLETIDAFRPKVALLLNITEDHSDRYKDFAEYAETKMAIFRNQGATDLAVINADDPELAARADRIRAEKVPFSLARPLSEGVSLDGPDIVYRNSVHEERYPRSLLRIRGTQNVENAMAAIAAGRRMGVPAEAVRDALATFPGLPHRVEFVRQVRGVSWFNDSKGTNVGAVLKCLEGFSEPVVLIAGGKDKGIDFRPLREPLGRKARAAVLLDRKSVV
jgi:UDP-N-acetylmuramoylalanine--D-glutamate ligase